MGLVETMAVVMESVAARQVVRLTYLDRKGSVTEREVEPVIFLAAAQDWYLIGWCRLRAAPRLFRLARIGSIYLLDEAYPPRDLESTEPKITDLVAHALADVPART
jgi:predicted DNA-binding transcriptional regulator YafY